MRVHRSAKKWPIKRSLVCPERSTNLSRRSAGLPVIKIESRPIIDIRLGLQLYRTPQPRTSYIWYFQYLSWIFAYVYIYIYAPLIRSTSTNCNGYRVLENRHAVKLRSAAYSIESHKCDYLTSLSLVL